MGDGGKTAWTKTRREELLRFGGHSLYLPADIPASYSEKGKAGSKAEGEKIGILYFSKAITKPLKERQNLLKWRRNSGTV